MEDSEAADESFYIQRDQTQWNIVLDHDDPRLRNPNVQNLYARGMRRGTGGLWANTQHSRS